MNARNISWCLCAMWNSWCNVVISFILHLGLGLCLRSESLLSSPSGLVLLHLTSIPGLVHPASTSKVESDGWVCTANTRFPLVIVISVPAVLAQSWPMKYTSSWVVQKGVLIYVYINVRITYKNILCISEYCVQISRGGD